MAFKYKILKPIEEKQNQIHVTVETVYGKRKYCFDKCKAALSEETGKPKWFSELKRILTERYETINKDNSLPKKEVFKELADKEFSL